MIHHVNCGCGNCLPPFLPHGSPAKPNHRRHLQCGSCDRVLQCLGQLVNFSPLPEPLSLRMWAPLLLLPAHSTSQGQGLIPKLYSEVIIWNSFLKIFSFKIITYRCILGRFKAAWWFLGGVGSLHCQAPPSNERPLLSYFPLQPTPLKTPPPPRRESSSSPVLLFPSSHRSYLFIDLYPN